MSAGRSTSRSSRRVGRRRGVLCRARRPDRAPVPRHGRAVRPRRPADRGRQLAAGAVRRPPRRGRVRPPGDRRQARAAGDRARPRRGRLPAQVALLAEADDIVIGFGGGAGGRGRDRGRPRPRLPDDRLRPDRRRVGGGAAGRRSVHRPGAGRDACITCCGSSCTSSSSTAGCCRGAGRGRCTTPARPRSCTRFWPRASTTSRRSSTTSAGRC